jgi:Flp pilus assembly secretin CpaC
MRKNMRLPAIVAFLSVQAATVPGGTQAADMPERIDPRPGVAVVANKRVTEVASVAALNVVIDYARLLRLDEDAKTIVIGNPAVLDATLSDGRTVVLTGKAKGTTNLIVLDENAREVENLLVNVVQGRHVMTVYRGIVKETYNCIDSCTPMTAPADGQPQAATPSAAGRNGT